MWKGGGVLQLALSCQVKTGKNTIARVGGGKV